MLKTTTRVRWRSGVREREGGERESEREREMELERREGNVQEGLP